MNWHIWKCSGIVCSCSTERGIRERENEMSGIVIEKVRKSFDTKDGVVEALKDVNHRKPCSSGCVRLTCGNVFFG